MAQIYRDHLLKLIDLAQNPHMMMSPSILKDREALRVIFIVVAVVAGCLVFGLIIWDDAMRNAPVATLPDDEPEDKDLDIQDMLDKSRQSNEILKGSTDKYDWQQTENELDLFVHLTNELAEAKSKDIKIHFHPKTMVVQIIGAIHLEGELYAEIIPSECNWQIDSDSSPRKLWITLVKRTKTSRNLHWSCVLRGDKSIDTNSLGPMVSTIDTNDPVAMKKAVSELRQRVRDKNSSKH